MRLLIVFHVGYLKPIRNGRSVTRRDISRSLQTYVHGFNIINKLGWGGGGEGSEHYTDVRKQSSAKLKKTKQQ